MAQINRLLATLLFFFLLVRKQFLPAIMATSALLRALLLVSAVLSSVYAADLPGPAKAGEGDDMCCEGECEGDLQKYYSIDTRHNMCGECCMLDSDYKKYKLFEPGLTKANVTSPCTTQLGYPTYDSTVTHGGGPITMTLDLYDPAEKN